MRRPTFERWMRRRILAATHEETFDLRTIATRVQHYSSGAFAAALLLYAHEAGRAQELLDHIWRDDLRREYEQVLAKISGRSVQKLALRGTPMMSLPADYRTIMDAYAAAYHTPERMAQAKRQLWEQSRTLQRQRNVPSSVVARELGLNASNVASYLKNGATGRISLDSAKAILAYLQNAPEIPVEPPDLRNPAADRRDAPQGNSSTEAPPPGR